MIEDLKKKEEDDEMRNDYDPEGYDLYEQSVRLILFTFSKVERPHWKGFRIRSDSHLTKS